MILLTRLNGVNYYLNAELVQTVEATPDTVITLTNHEKMVVKEPAKVVVDRMIAYQQRIRQKQEPETLTGKPGGE